jgi:hypothetical protein
MADVIDLETFRTAVLTKWSDDADRPAFQVASEALRTRLW